MARLEMTLAWHGKGEGWVDSRGCKEGEEASRPVPRSLPAGQVSIPLVSRRKSRVREYNRFGLHRFSVSHRGCVWPLIAWHQAPSPTCFWTHSPASLLLSRYPELPALPQTHNPPAFAQGEEPGPTLLGGPVPEHYSPPGSRLPESSLSLPGGSAASSGLPAHNPSLSGLGHTLPQISVDMAILPARRLLHRVEDGNLCFILEA